MTEATAEFDLEFRRPPLWPLILSMALFLIFYAFWGVFIVVAAAGQSVRGILALALVVLWVMFIVRGVHKQLSHVSQVRVAADGLTIAPLGAWTWDQIRSFELREGFANTEINGQRRSISMQKKRMSDAEWGQFVGALTHYRPDCTASWQEQLRARNLA